MKTHFSNNKKMKTQELATKVLEELKAEGIELSYSANAVTDYDYSIYYHAGDIFNNHKVRFSNHIAYSKSRNEEIMFNTTDSAFVLNYNINRICGLLKIKGYTYGEINVPVGSKLVKGFGYYKVA